MIFLIELVAIVSVWTVSPAVSQQPRTGLPVFGLTTNTEALGRVLYTQYFYFFQAAGLILLVAMIGAIVLTLRERPGVKRQNIARQNARTPTDAVEIRKVPFREGV